jgi:hypothetical protein
MMIAALLVMSAAGWGAVTDPMTGEPCPVPLAYKVAALPGEHRAMQFSAHDMVNTSPQKFERCANRRAALAFQPDRKPRRRNNRQ